MDERLNESDLDTIIGSLEHYKTNVENYDQYPSYEFKLKQLERVESAMCKIKVLRQVSSEK